MKVSFSCVTNNKGPLTKTVTPNGKGGITKTPAAHLTNGNVVRKTLPFEEFGPYLRTLDKKQAIIHGVYKHESATIVSKANFTGQPNTVTRSKKFFKYPDGPCIGLFDHDPKPNQSALDPDEFIKKICEVWPEFANLPTWSTPSTSSCIYDHEGNEISVGGNGFHLYFPWPNGQDLPELADRLFKKLWIAGHGFIFISKSGVCLKRTIFDKAVFAPERLDFVSGANCIECEQRLPDPVYREGGTL